MRAFPCTCDNDDVNVANKGFLMLTKAGAERQMSLLSNGERDFSGAITLLGECQKRPSLSGTDIAAECQASRDKAIQMKSYFSVACTMARQRTQEAAQYENAGEYQREFDASVSGLNYANACEDGDLKTRTKGFLLAAKAVAEHKLGSGDSETDLDEAIMLLEKCQTDPRFYGTDEGAQCESMEDTATRLKTSWEMEKY